MFTLENEERLQINVLIFYFKKTEKEEQIKTKVRRK
jgi:hypothetical protein